MRYIALALVAGLLVAAARSQELPSDAAHLKALDQILDLYVRDGFVYYRALKLERAKLDGYVNLLASVRADRLSRNEQLAFWLNAYNALVLRVVIDHYPVDGRSNDYPRHSIRQIPGAFDRLTHRVGGRALTLDQIEQTVLPQFNDPRVYLALGRGAAGGGRLRSEAFAPGTLEMQLSEVANECASRSACVQVDRQANELLVCPIFSWREKDFVAAYGARVPATFANRTPLERAVLAFVEPTLLRIEREALEKNTFRVSFLAFDWSLNDLTGRGGR